MGTTGQNTQLGKHLSIVLDSCVRGMGASVVMVPVGVHPTLPPNAAMASDFAAVAGDFWAASGHMMAEVESQKEIAKSSQLELGLS